MFLALLVFTGTASVLLHFSANDLAVAAFNPLEYHINAVACPAVDRALNKTVNITIGEYTFAYMRIATWSLMA